MQLLYCFLRDSPWQLGFSVLAGILSGLGNVALIALVNQAIAQDLPSRLPLASLFAGLCLLVFLTRIITSVLVMRMGQKAVQDLRVSLSRRILAAPLAHLQRLGAPMLLANLTEDVTVVAHAFEWIPVVCINAAIVIGVFAYVGWLSPTLLGLVTAMSLLGILLYQMQARRGVVRLQAAREHDDALYGHFRGLTGGIKELKLNRRRRDAFLSEGLEPAAANYRRDYAAGITAYILASNWGHILFYLVIGMAVFVLPWHLDMSAEALSGCTLVILYMMSPLTTVVDGIPILTRASIALRKIDNIGQSCGATSVERVHDAVPPLAKPVPLELVRVTHHYRTDSDDRPFTLGPVSLTVQPGEVVFIIGGNGSGKTTLALLLVGLYVPESGNIRLGKHRITEHNLEFYRQHFAAVFADFHLFESLSGLAAKELDSKGRAYLQSLQLDHKVRIENGQISTLNLSQGQRKRLALLVAYLEDRPFYLFDEWAADQDPLFKAVFYREIIPALKARGKTVIAITHDDQYFALADRCLKLENGQVAAMAKRSAAPPTEFGLPAEATL